MAENMSLFLLFCFFLSIFVLSFVVVMGFVPVVGGVIMGFMAGCGCCCDGYCGQMFLLFLSWIIAIWVRLAYWGEWGPKVLEGVQL